VSNPSYVRFHDLVELTAAARPGAPALTSGDTTLTYGELSGLAGAAAGGLARSGLRRGERVVVALDKRVETVAAVLATSLAGGVFVPANPLLRPHQLLHVLDDCAPRVLVTSPDRLRALRAELASCKSVETVVVVGGPAVAEPGDRFAVLGWDELGDAGGPPPGGAVDGGVDGDVAAIFYTSGSTGRPKGVVLSHRNLIVGATSVASYLDNNDDDRILAVLPLSFDAGFSQLTTAFHAGAHVVLVNYLLAGDVVTLCARHRITGLTAVPPLWIQLVERDWPPEATAHLRYFANTGGRMPRATLDRLRAIFPAARPYLMYGLTEAFRSTYLDPDQVDVRPDSIGRAIPNAEILVVRPDGRACGPGEEGELVHRGPLVALGYWNDAERTAERFRPPPGRPDELTTPELAVWSGDIVTRDEEGYLYFVGRRDDMIKTSGYRVSPTEIEEVVYETGLVRDVVALGVPDDRLGQRIELVVTAPEGTAADPQALLARLRTRLPGYMVPRAVHTRATMPRSPNGKFDRAALRGELT
jgi:acyl-CoA ligase (AMP-forming) (exosortase A-associated)